MKLVETERVIPDTVFEYENGFVVDAAHVPVPPRAWGDGWLVRDDKARLWRFFQQGKS